MALSQKVDHKPITKIELKKLSSTDAYLSFMTFQSTPTEGEKHGGSSREAMKKNSTIRKSKT